ncbi:iron complex transport system substrate-binding protein [Pelagirhabdus alkalitolerans]|uniref:Iron complex transport system substrate-binding protein n=1 Tax=Pelagirhabdus alkalitolerans TaxID=1612202 RepID=A0A1G6J103_9BACI|nr:ABC transporter substrate-binding protein [Pelagirhabdus alkalitolerans]SDC12263.1 iron complex transport system substrate-binding protein [Pelagirhabdus alkalitolerans]
MKNKKIFIVLLMCITLLIGFLSACGQDTDSNNSTDNDLEESEEKHEKETKTFEAANGTVEIPSHPERIIVVADSYVGYFLTLGIQPIGVSDFSMENRYFEGKLDGVESIGESNNPSMEKMVDLNPDLIITFNDANAVENLEKIAPTIAINYGEKSYKEQLKEFGDMTGREKEADEWIEQWESKIAEWKPKIQEIVGDQTVSILSPFSKGIYAFGHNFGRGGEIIYDEFDLKAPETVQEIAIDSGEGWADFSLETLPEIAGDIIFTCPWSGDEADPEHVYGSKLWEELPAVKQDRVIELDPDAAFFNDPTSLDQQLDFIIESLQNNA